MVTTAPAATGEATFRYSGAGQVGAVEVQVHRRASVEAVLGADPGPVTRALAALASPIRFLLLRAMLDGPQTSQQLRAVLDAGSVGQLYHHLKELISAGLVIQPARNLYTIPPGKVVAVCVIIMAATHLADANHQAPPPPPGPLTDEDKQQPESQVRRSP